MQATTILIVEDHILVREAWQLILEEDPRFKVIGTCASGEEAVDMAIRLVPDVILMDINLKGMDGLQATEKILNVHRGIRIIGLSMHTELSYVKKMMNAGAAGYVTKNSGTDELLIAIEHVRSNNKYVCEEIREALSVRFTENSTGKKTVTLSEREMEIIGYVKEGHSSREIASMLGLSRKTVDQHRYNIMKKLNVNNTASLINQVNKGIGLNT